MGKVCALHFPSVVACDMIIAMPSGRIRVSNLYSLCIRSKHLEVKSNKFVTVTMKTASLSHLLQLNLLESFSLKSIVTKLLVVCCYSSPNRQ